MLDGDSLDIFISASSVVAAVDISGRHHDAGYPAGPPLCSAPCCAFDSTCSLDPSTNAYGCCEPSTSCMHLLTAWLATTNGINKPESSAHSTHPSLIGQGSPALQETGPPSMHGARHMCQMLLMHSKWLLQAPSQVTLYSHAHVGSRCADSVTKCSCEAVVARMRSRAREAFPCAVACIMQAACRRADHAMAAAALPAHRVQETCR